MRTTLTEKLHQAVAKDPYWWLRVADIQETECGEDGVYRVPPIMLRTLDGQPQAKTTHTYVWEMDSAAPGSDFTVEFRVDPESIRRLNEQMEKLSEAFQNISLRINWWGEAGRSSSG